jgi:hypothetical protein
MRNKSIFCIAPSEAQASEIVHRLKHAGFADNDISALLPDKTGTKDFAHEHHTKAPEGAAIGGVIGGIVSGILGWLAGVGFLAIPGLGAFVAAGPVLGALSGAAVGGVLGGVVGALVGLGVPEYEAKRYTGKIREGNILISVHCGAEGQSERARNIFEQAGAYDIASSAEVGVKKEMTVIPPAHQAVRA